MSELFVYECAKCSKTWDEDDFVEIQECLHKYDIGGYGSVFGDGQHWSITLCQKCAQDVIGDYIVYHNRSSGTD